MAEYSKKKIGAQLERVAARPFRRLYYTCGTDMGRLRNYVVNPCPRLMCCVSGEVHLRLHVNNGACQELFLQPGEAIYGVAMNQIAEQWDRRQELFAAIMCADMTRLLYIKHDGISPPPMPAPNPTLFFHVKGPINAVGKAIITALDHIALTATPEQCFPGGPRLADALVENLKLDFAASKAEEPSQRNTHRQFLWNEIYGFVADNFASPYLSREMLAKHFKVHVVHISRLFQQELGMNFMDYVNMRRFELARQMLLDFSLSIKEISDGCGFHYPSYFIRAFRKKFHLSPGEYREQLLQARRNTPKAKED